MNFFHVFIFSFHHVSFHILWNMKGKKFSIVFNLCTVGLSQIRETDSVAQPQRPSRGFNSIPYNSFCCKCSWNLFSQWAVLSKNQVSDARSITRGSIHRASLRVLTFQVNLNSNIAACLIRFGALFFFFLNKNAIVTIALLKLPGVEVWWMVFILTYF